MFTSSNGKTFATLGPQLSVVVLTAAGALADLLALGDAVTADVGVVVTAVPDGFSVTAGTGLAVPTVAMVPGTLAVKKATLAVTANNLTMKQGAAVPALTYGMSGFVNGDVQGKVTTGAPKLTTTATLKSAAGKYPITVAAGTLAAGNYGFSYVNGTLTVTK